MCVFTFKAVLHWVTWADYTLIGYIAPGRKKIELIAQACIFFFLRPGAPNSFLFLVVRPLVAFLFQVVRPGAAGSVLVPTRC